VSFCWHGELKSIQVGYKVFGLKKEKKKIGYKVALDTSS
jgi:hypothetical protein